MNDHERIQALDWAVIVIGALLLINAIFLHDTHNDLRELETRVATLEASQGEEDD